MDAAKLPTVCTHLPTDAGMGEPAAPGLTKSVCRQAGWSLSKNTRFSENLLHLVLCAGESPVHYAEPSGLTSWRLTPVLAATTFHLLLVHLPLLDQTSKTSTLPISPTPRLEELGPPNLKTKEEEFQQNALRVQRPNRGENDFKNLVSSAITGHLGWGGCGNYVFF